jgi:hypothetical protein
MSLHLTRPSPRRRAPDEQVTRWPSWWPGARGCSTRRPAARSLGMGIERLEDRITPTCDCYANLFAGPRRVSIDSNQSVLLESVFNSLLPGSSVDLAVADWNAVATGKVQLNALLAALVADRQLSSPSQALGANVSLGQLFDATADAVPADGDTAALHAALLGLSRDVSSRPSTRRSDSGISSRSRSPTGASRGRR